MPKTAGVKEKTYKLNAALQQGSVRECDTRGERLMQQNPLNA